MQKWKYHRRAEMNCRQRSRRDNGSLSPATGNETSYVHDLKLLVPNREHYRAAVDYRSWKLRHESQRYDNDTASKVLRMPNYVAFKMIELAFKMTDYDSVSILLWASRSFAISEERRKALLYAFLEIK